MVEVCLNKLKTDYPKCFSDARDKPLKRRIHKDILKDNPNLNKYLLSKALSFYSTSYQYKTALIKNDGRFDLDGRRNGEVTEDEKESAKKWIETAKKRKKTQKKVKDKSKAVAP